MKHKSMVQLYISKVLVVAVVTIMPMTNHKIGLLVKGKTSEGVATIQSVTRYWNIILLPDQHLILARSRCTLTKHDKTLSKT